MRFVDRSIILHTKNIAVIILYHPSVMRRRFIVDRIECSVGDRCCDISQCHDEKVVVRSVVNSHRERARPWCLLRSREAREDDLREKDVPECFHFSRKKRLEDKKFPRQMRKKASLCEGREESRSCSQVCGGRVLSLHVSISVCN